MNMSVTLTTRQSHRCPLGAFRLRHIHTIQLRHGAFEAHNSCEEYILSGFDGISSPWP
jgi:hypothetical protein